MSFLLTIGACASCLTLGFTMGSVSKKISPKSDEKNTATNTSSRKYKRTFDPSKDAVTIMGELYKFGMDDFKIISSEGKSTKYQYLENGYLFTVIRCPKKTTTISVEKNGKIYLYYLYNYETQSYLRKEMTRSLIESHPRNKAIDTVTDFVNKVLHSYSWTNLKAGLTIKDDIMSIEPHIFEDVPSSEEMDLVAISETIEDKTKTNDNMSQLQSVIHKNSSKLKEDIVQLFDDIITDMKLCLIHNDKLDVMKQHVIEDLIQMDLEKLLLSYKELSDSNQQEVHDKVLDALQIMDNELKEILISLEKENLMKVEQIVEVIKTREYS